MAAFRDGRNGRILLVEDDPDSAEAIQLLLEYEGYTVEWASTGATALDRLDQPEVPPLVAVLLDLGLPDLTPEALQSEIALRAHRLPPVVLLSAAPELSIRRLAVGMDAGAALRKPCDANSLLAALQQVGQARKPSGPAGAPRSRSASARPRRHHFRH